MRAYLISTFTKACIHCDCDLLEAVDSYHSQAGRQSDELEVRIFHEPALARGQSLWGGAHAVRGRCGEVDRVVQMDISAFLASSESLRVLRIAGWAGFPTLFEGLTLPHLHTLEVGPASYKCVGQTAACLWFLTVTCLFPVWPCATSLS